MFDLFVYGTLKKGDINHNFLDKRMLTDKGEKAEFLRHEILKDHSLYLLNGFNFPVMIKEKGGRVYGEVYQVDSDKIRYIDMLEQEGVFYNRVDNGKLGYSYYLWNEREHGMLYTLVDKIETGYWEVKRDDIGRSDVIYNVMIDNREYSDTADKLVFHMRFFDGKRAPTNKIYMDLVKRRSHQDLNTENEDIFIRDCIIQGIVSETKAPQI